MKPFTNRFHPSGQGRAAIGLIAIITTLLLSSNAAHARAYCGVRTTGRVAVAGPDRVAVAGPRGVAVAGPNGAAAVRRPYPGGYIHTLPVGYRPVVYGGYNCYYAGGVYYRPEFYQGSTVYIVVNP